MVPEGSIFDFDFILHYPVLLSINGTVGEIRDLIRSIHKAHSAHSHGLITEQPTSLRGRSTYDFSRTSRLSSPLDKQASIYKLPPPRPDLNLIGLLV